MQRLLMIMGIQRSGTNALFNSFSKAGGCIPLLDTENSEIYDQFYLRPEPVIRPFLAGQSKPILLKPVNETKKRSIDAVFEEYRAYDLKVLYIYRDPVNAFFSQIEMWPEYDDVHEFIEQWNKRNLYATSLTPEWKNRFAIVKYQDLSEDPKVFDQVCKFFGIRGTYLFRADKNRGQERLTVSLRKQIEDGTRNVHQQLDEQRAFLPDSSGISLRKIYRNIRFFLIQQLRKLQLLPQ
jgi:hypothetical protein